MSTQPAAISPFANMKGNDASQIKQHDWLKIAIQVSLRLVKVLL